MKSKFKTTNFSGNSVLVAIGSDGNKLYKAIDIARSLGYKRPNAAVKRICKNPVTLVAPTLNQFGGRSDQPVKFIDGQDIARMLYECTLPNAVKIRKKMEEEIAEKKAAKEGAAKKAAAEKTVEKADKNDGSMPALEGLVKEICSVLAGESGKGMPNVIVISF